MAEETEKLSYRYIIENAERHFLSVDHKWMLWVWCNVVLIKPTGKWSPEDAEIYINQFFALFKSLKTTWPKVYYVLDMNSWELQTEEFRRYLRANWTKLFNREDLILCFVEAKAMKRIIWTSIFQLIDMQDRLFLFEDFSEAFAWIRGRLIRNGT